MADSQVEAVTNSMAAVKVNDAPAKDAPPAKDAAQISTAAAAAAISVAEGRRLYIGNLAFETTEDKLKEMFHGYLLDTVSIPTNPRTGRHVGYAFVDLHTPSEAERAVNELNGLEVLERKLSVQLARKNEAGEGEDGHRAPRNRNPRTRARGGRTRSGKEGETAAEGETANGAEDPAHHGEGGGRPRKQRGPPQDGLPSKTKVMVANLPFDLNEEKLMELFKDYQPVSAKVALRQIPMFMIKKLKARGEPRRGRGFGFVTLSSEDMQQKAIAEMNDKDIDGRQIAVKVAVDAPGKEDDAPNQTADETEPAATAAASAPPAASETAQAAA